MTDALDTRPWCPLCERNHPRHSVCTKLLLRREKPEAERVGETETAIEPVFPFRPRGPRWRLPLFDMPEYVGIHPKLDLEPCRTRWETDAEWRAREEGR